MSLVECHSLGEVGVDYVKLDILGGLVDDILSCYCSIVTQILVVEVLTCQQEGITVRRLAQEVEDDLLLVVGLGQLHGCVQAVVTGIGILLIVTHQVDVAVQGIVVACLCSIQQGSSSFQVGAAEQCINSSLRTNLLEFLNRLVGIGGSQNGVERLLVGGLLHSVAYSLILLLGIQTLNAGRKGFLVVGLVRASGSIQ